MFESKLRLDRFYFRAFECHQNKNREMKKAEPAHRRTKKVLNFSFQKNCAFFENLETIAKICRLRTSMLLFSYQVSINHIISIFIFKYKKLFTILNSYYIYFSEGWKEYLITEIRHPRTQKGHLYAFNGDKTCLCEVVCVNDPYSAWFIGNTIGKCH